MSDEDIIIFYKELSARLPYRVKVEIEGWDGEPVVADMYDISTDKYARISTEEDCDHIYIDQFTPYLRRMADMTDDEIDEYNHLTSLQNTPENADKLLEFIYSHQLDYRNWIDKGVAKQADNGLYQL